MSSGTPDLGDALTVDITTTGRRSGRPTRIEIWMFRVDGRYVITGTPGPRDWLANLRNHEALTVHVKGEAATDLAAVATEITDEGFRRRVFEAGHTSWYRTQAELDRLVATSPMVEITFS
jgi:deazaflavin-dependent oxidoreductase (nitroreductase family)